jgi:hypothetical protein
MRLLRAAVSDSGIERLEVEGPQVRIVLDIGMDVVHGASALEIGGSDEVETGLDAVETRVSRP